MSRDRNEREFDIILYGATGFTGRQASAYLQQHAEADIRWAVAGRNRDKLQALKAGVPVLVADSTDATQASDLVAKTHVLLSMAGPFELYSDQLVQACVQHRTHYVDITGEVAWVRSLIDRFHSEAEANGVRIVPFCGFDSVPSDLGVFLLSKLLGPDLVQAKAYFQARGGRPNGGTIASAHRTYESGAHRQGEDPFLLTPGVRRDLLPMEEDPTRAAYDKDVGAWTAPFPMSLIDSRVVRRSCALRGLDIAYGEFLIFRGPLGRVWARAATLGTRLFYAALRAPFTRNLATRLLQAGSGPSEKTMDRGFFTCRVWGRTVRGDTGEVTLSGKGDPANRITVLCACEAALAIAVNTEELPTRGGVLTPSMGIGDAFVTRLRRRGVEMTETLLPALSAS